MTLCIYAYIPMAYAIVEVYRKCRLQSVLPYDCIHMPAVSIRYTVYTPYLTQYIQFLMHGFGTSLSIMQVSVHEPGDAYTAPLPLDLTQRPDTGFCLL
jgi:hypothetical protein